MIHATFIVVLLTGPMCHQAASDASAADAEASLILFDRLHQTFILLNQAVFPAYEEHFRDEPDKLATVRHYSTRLAETLRSGSPTESSDSSEADSEDASAEHLMRQALAAARAGRQDLLDRHLQRLGSQPHAVLQRLGDAGSLATAHCLLYDPELLWAHRRLWELKIGRHAPGDPINVQDGLADRHMEIRRLREQPENAELSLRKFMDKYRSLVWELGWQFRCLGLQEEHNGNTARSREMYLRAWAIGDAQFPVSERGRLSRFEPVFLAELGDVYARLQRYDLMLRYMYSDQGLPAQFAMARPVAELARAAEAVRLARRDESAQDQLEELLPETVSQILFEQPVPPPSPSATARIGVNRGAIDLLGWTFIVCGLTTLVVVVVWRARRTSRSPAPKHNSAPLSTAD